MHCYGHGGCCLRLLHPKRNEDFGLGDGEASERLWSKFGRYHNILKEMSPVKRTEMLEDVCRDVRKVKRVTNTAAISDKYRSVLKLIDTLTTTFNVHQINAATARQYWEDERQSLLETNIVIGDNTERSMKHKLQTLIIETAFHQRDLYSQSTPGTSMNEL